MGARVPQADMLVIATGEELMLQRMYSQAPELICVALTIKRMRTSVWFEFQSLKHQLYSILDPQIELLFYTKKIHFAST